MVTAKVNAPNYQAYGNSDLEKVFAQGFSQADTGNNGGALYAMLVGAGADRNRMVDRYSEDLAQTNFMQQSLAQQEMQQELLRESLKQVPEYAKAGVPIYDIPLLSRISRTAGMDPETLSASTLVNALKRAQIAKEMAAAEASRASGQPQFTIQTDVSPTGVSLGTITGKGRNPAELSALQTALVAQELYKNRGLPMPQGPNILARPNYIENRQDQQRRAAQNHTILQGQ